MKEKLKLIRYEYCNPCIEVDLVKPLEWSGCKNYPASIQVWLTEEELDKLWLEIGQYLGHLV